MNLIMLIGNLGRDPELRTTQAGKTMATFGLATTERWKDGDGERQEATTWHNCVAFGAITKVIEEWVHKGDKLFVSGRLSKRKYKTKDGDEKEAMEVIVDKLEMLGNRGQGKSRSRDEDEDEEEEDYEEGHRQAKRKSTSAKKKGSVIPDDLDDEIPF